MTMPDLLSYEEIAAMIVAGESLSPTMSATKKMPFEQNVQEVYGRHI